MTDTAVKVIAQVQIITYFNVISHEGEIRIGNQKKNM
jgi:hypothetical protein